VALGQQSPAPGEGRDDPGAKCIALVQALGIDNATAPRRTRISIEDDNLANLKERKGRPAPIALGGPLPEERRALPHRVGLVKEGWGVGESPLKPAQPCNPSFSARLRRPTLRSLQRTGATLGRRATFCSHTLRKPNGKRP
jgi:hypothetical protein